MKLEDFEKKGKLPDYSHDDAASPEFNAIWDVIKPWSIALPEFYSGYMEATGNHVMLILNELKKKNLLNPLNNTIDIEIE